MLAVLVATALTGALVTAPSSAATIPKPPAACASPLPTTPLVDSVHIAPGAVDVTSGPASVVVSVQAHDTIALSAVTVRMRLDRPAYDRVGALEQASATLRLTAGTATAGTWSGTVTVPSWGRSGRWLVDYVVLNDSGSGYAYYSPSQPGMTTPFRDVSWGAGWDSAITVTARTDTTSPTIAAFRAGQRRVDARTSPGHVSFAVATREGQSGIASVTVFLTDTERHERARASLRRAAGGTWTGTAHIGTWAGAGTWGFTVVARDRAGNRVTLTPHGLAARRWASKVAVVSGIDTAYPRLVSMSFPASVDTRSGPVRVPVSFRVADASSGVVAVPHVQFAPPQTIYIGGPEFRLSSVTGTLHDRTYRGYIDLPQCWQTEDWYPSMILTDGAGNERWYGDGDFRPPVSSNASLHYVALDAFGPFGWDASVGQPPHQRVDINFGEPVLLDRDPSAALAIEDSTGAAVPGAWSCTNAAGPVACQAEGADVTTISFTPQTQPTLPATWDLRYLGSYPDTGIYDLAGNSAYPGHGSISVGPGAGYVARAPRVTVTHEGPGFRVSSAATSAGR